MALTILSLGAGVQSSTLALMACEGKLHFDAVLFADTGAEPGFVYRHLKWVAKQLHKSGIPFHVVRNGNLLEDLFAGTRFASIPAYVRNLKGEEAMLKRQCTEEYKLKAIRRWLRANGATAKLPARVAIGISNDEAHRMRDSSVRYVQHWYPLVDMGFRRADCLKWLKERGYPIPPKSSCVCCPFHTNSYWRRLKLEHPEEFERACQFDERIRTLSRIHGECYLHRSLKPLRLVNFGEEQIEMDFECGGYCLT